jgi:hypothetical protein
MKLLASSLRRTTASAAPSSQRVNSSWTTGTSYEPSVLEMNFTPLEPPAKWHVLELHVRTIGVGVEGN